MGILDGILDVFSRGGHSTPMRRRGSLGGRPNANDMFTIRRSQPPARNTAEFLEAFNKSPRLQGAAKIALDLASVTGKLYRIDKNGAQEEIEEHPFLDFFDTPNPRNDISYSALWELMQLYVDIKGEAFALIERDSRGRPTELWPLPPHWVVYMPRLGEDFYIIRNSDGERFEIHTDDIFIQKKHTLADPYGRGTGTAEAIADEIETDEYAAKYQKTLFYESAVPDLVIGLEGATEKQVEAFKESWLQKFKGLFNQRGTAVTGAKLSVQRLSDTLKDLDMVNGRQYLRDVALEHFGIPPEIIGHTQNSNRATSTNSRAIYVENVLNPRIRARQDAINEQLLYCFGHGLYFEFDNITPNDEEFTLQKTNEGLSRGAITVNEWREANGWDEILGLDVIYTPGGVPVSINLENGTDIVAAVQAFNSASYGAFGMLGASVDPTNTAAFKGATLALAAAGHATDPEQRKGRQTKASAFETTHNLRMDRFANEYDTVLRQYFSDQADRVTASLSDATINQILAGAMQAATSVDESAAGHVMAGFIQEEMNKIVDWQAESQRLHELLESKYRETIGLTFNNMRVDVPRGKNMQDFIQKLGLEERAQQINETTSKYLANNMAVSVDSGHLSPDSIRETAQQTIGDPQRIHTIADSESGIATESADFQAHIDAGYTQKEWWSSADGDVRLSHRQINGEKRPINQPFSNGCMYPRDPNGPIGETIHCRCICTYF